jgi:peptidoglycan/LPS O-acetylase OafA/YrhL
MGFQNDPWTYRFFPAELMFFLSGMISFRIYSRFRDRIPLSCGRVVCFCVIAATVVFQYAPGGSVKMMAYFALVTLGLPFIFRVTRSSRADRQLGEMSYPIYLSHILVFGVASSLPILAEHVLLLRVTALSTTFLVSFVVVRTVTRSLEEFRQRRTRAIPSFA